MKSLLFIFLLAFFFIFLLAYLRTPTTMYVGTVVDVDNWKGSATLKTVSQYNNADTLIKVVKRKYERFVVGQTITVWTGGNLIGCVASTEPQ